MIADCEEDLPDLLDECSLCGENLSGEDALHAHCSDCCEEGYPCCEARERTCHDH